ncbi:MAG TPA: PIN domain-containing protein [Planctomycetota bacterium]|nr:PIN domain-containing protein [Planctomycetota bacterium]
MKLRVYLDTSVFSALFDDRVPERRAATEEFWMRSGDFDLLTSRLAAEELGRTQDMELRAKLVGLLEGINILPVTEEMTNLARRYVADGIFSEDMFDDAVHVAAAVLSRQDILLSWNFKHLVNRRRRAQINQTSVLLGLPTIEVAAPPEV